VKIALAEKGLDLVEGAEVELLFAYPVWEAVGHRRIPKIRIPN
jgi:hypothetical protein